ncbi:NAD(P)/FAD-dependent oxidoreductase [Microseira sp. BLCC-F43]|jgi:flavin-dependent dehydrogenase|uniref:NAD(P)/FAD-dependent oxidoreductase n=1 Tax=Microseira sp. BLCC-F43 TaxID=3153602 RepID=UPI0035BA98FD
MQNFDVCIFGAGPAGIAASMVLSQAGANIALICKPQAFPRATKPCWETLSPRVEPILQQLGLTDALKDSCEYRITAHVSSWGSEQVAWESVMKRAESGNWLINRHHFDMALRKSATAQGIKIFEASAVDIKRSQDRWHLTIGGTKNFDITTNFLIEASGYGATVARRLGAKRIVVDKLVAHWLIFPTEYDPDKTVRIDALESGWLFTVRVGNQRLLCFFTDGDLLKTGSEISIKHVMEKRILEAPAIQSILAGHSISNISAYGVTFASTSTLHRAVGKCWVACGDAAQTYDPLSSQGSYQALLSGCRAGVCLIDYHNGDSLALENYARHRRNEFIQYLRKLCKQYRLELRWPDSVFWSRRYNFLNSEAVRQITPN